ncbi:hypothetical protein CROQUDRAFT_45436, partial [Cronartium quercuum f. sp. fusiforme G11]
DYPTTKDWPQFKGEGEYNHLEFIKWVDLIIADLKMPEELVTAKLGLIYEGLARQWYLKVRSDMGPMSWPQWKIQIENRFGTDAWKHNMEEAFMRDTFNPSIHKSSLQWSLQKKKRIQAFDPDSSTKRIIEKILFRMDGTVRNAIKSLMGSHMTWDKFIEAFQDVCKDNNIMQKYKTSFVPRRQLFMSRQITSEKPNPSSTKAQPSTTEKKTGPRCPTCGITDPTHNWRTCKGKKRKPSMKLR